jgi:hypothetical protein
VAAAGKAQIFAHRLAEDGAAGIEDARDYGGIDVRHVVFEHARAVAQG